MNQIRARRGLRATDPAGEFTTLSHSVVGRQGSGTSPPHYVPLQRLPIFSGYATRLYSQEPLPVKLSAHTLHYRISRRSLYIQR